MTTFLKRFYDRIDHTNYTVQITIEDYKTIQRDTIEAVLETLKQEYRYQLTDEMIETLTEMKP